MSFAFFRTLGRHAAIAAFALAGTTLVAQDAPNTPSEPVLNALKSLKALEDAKNFNQIIATLDALPAIKADSYDMALILNAKANTYVRMEQYSKAIEPMEKALDLADKFKYFDDKTKLDLCYYLGQLCAQEGLNNKVPAQQQVYFDKALTYFRRWLDTSKKPTPEIMVSYASILYYKATANPQKIDHETLKLAKAEVQKGLIASTHPKDSFYTLLLSILQQDNDFIHSTELLELYLKNNPNKKDFWQALMGSYLNLSNETKDPIKSREYLIRTIATLERAQALGFMQTSKDYMYLVSFYNTAGQTSRAADLLYTGLKSGKIENDPKHWQNLGLLLQQANQELRAVSVLEEAAQKFPNNGQIELLIGEIYRQMDRTKDAHRHYREAIKRGGLDKPYFAHQILAYAAFETENFDEALKAVLEAEDIAKKEGSKQDPQLVQLKAAIQGVIDERAHAHDALPAH